MPHEYNCIMDTKANPMDPLQAFDVLDLRVGRILRAEPNPKARKAAYKLWIDFGELGERTSSAQVTDLYTPEELVGKLILASSGGAHHTHGVPIAMCVELVEKGYDRYVREHSRNVGFTHDHFAVVPEGQVRLGYQFTRRLQGFVGYNFLYLRDVVRPGNQIDRNINATQNALFGGTGGVLTGPAAPPPQFTHSDFWAHGVNFGLEFRY